eukprot:1179211-Prorocentrum_minimum.AAC.5
MKGLTRMTKVGRRRALGGRVLHQGRREPAGADLRPHRQNQHHRGATPMLFLSQRLQCYDWSDLHRIGQRHCHVNQSNVHAVLCAHAHTHSTSGPTVLFIFVNGDVEQSGQESGQEVLDISHFCGRRVSEWSEGSVEEYEGTAAFSNVCGSPTRSSHKYGQKGGLASNLKEVAESEEEAVVVDQGAS